MTYRHDTIDEIIADCTAALLAHADLIVRARRMRQGPLIANGNSVVASVGYVGDEVRGTLTIVCTKQLIRETRPAVLRKQPREPEDAELHDWVGELGNQLLGRIKNKLAVHDVHFLVAPPSTFYADNLTLPPVSHPSPDWFEFETDCGQLLVRLQLCVPDGWTLREPVCRTDVPPNEGDLLLF